MDQLTTIELVLLADTHFSTRKGLLNVFQAFSLPAMPLNENDLSLDELVMVYEGICQNNGSVENFLSLNALKRMLNLKLAKERESSYAKLRREVGEDMRHYYLNNPPQTPLLRESPGDA